MNNWWLCTRPAKGSKAAVKSFPAGIKLKEKNVGTERREKKLNKGYKVEQIAGKVDYFVFYVDRSSLILAELRPSLRPPATHPIQSQSNTFFVFLTGDTARERYANKA